MKPHEQLEREWAEWNGLDPAGMVACSSGTAALHLALEALQLPPGSEVIVPDYTMIACARAVTLAGLTPVFVDCDERLLMDFSLVPPPSQAISALMAVHVYGRRFPLDHFSPNWGIKYIEDLAEGHGIKPSSFTDAACWSFYRNKIVAGEEGGAVWFKDPAHARRARRLRCLGFNQVNDYTHIPRGHNYRMSDAHADLVLESLYGSGSLAGPNRYNAVGKILARKEIEGWYDAACPPEWRMPRRDAVWVYDVLLPWKMSTVGGPRFSQVVATALQAEGVEARPGFVPMHEQEEYRGCRFVGRVEGVAGGEVVHYPMSSQMAQRVVYLPVQPGITTEAECRRAMDLIRRTLER